MSYKIGIIGYTGKLGTSLISHLNKEEFEIVLKANSKKWEVQDMPEMIINVSSASSIEQVTTYCLTHNISLIEGTSGLDDKCLKKIETAASSIPVLRAENFSYGHFLQQSLIKYLSGLMNKEADYHLAINERHSINKKDAPSATAKKLALICEQEELKTPTINYTRCGIPVSDHELHLTMNSEELVIFHGVADRLAIAEGITSAIRWFMDKPKGLWTMENVYQKK